MAKADIKDNKDNVRQNWGRKHPSLVELDLLTLQKESYQWFEEVGIKQVLDEISPIDDFTGKNWTLILKDYKIGKPTNTPDLCLSKGLILVDTKYEFGLHNGKLTLIDEIHTPDSSRFWIAKTYQSRVKKGLEPENFDKEFLRLWYVKRGYRGDGPPPAMAKELIVATAQRYIGVYEKLTGKKFKAFEYPIEERIKKNLKKYFS